MARGKPFKKGTPKPENSGRKVGVPNKRTVFVQGLMEEAVVEMGGLKGLVAWAKKSTKNRYAFWTILFPKLFPLQVRGAGKDGELLLHVKREELAQKLIEHGLPPTVLGLDLPKLEDLNLRTIDVSGNNDARDND